MKKMSLSLCWLLFFGSLFAQPIISDVIIPSQGDSIHLIRCQPIDFQVNATGPNQIWDFSELQPDPVEPEYYFKFTAPNNAPHIDRYPDADLVAFNPDGQSIYYTYDGTALEAIGAVAEVPTIGLAFGDYENAETEEIFPIEYNNNWSDAFDGNNVASAFSSEFSGMLDGTVEGYGTLILPSGTFQNVLRIKEERVYQIAGAPTQTSTFYRYASATYHLWLLSMESFPNNPPNIFYQDSPDIISSTSQLDLSDNIYIHPNPISSGQQLFITFEGNEIIQFQLFNSIGQSVSELIQLAGLNSNSFTIPTTLPSGIYFLKGINEQGFFIKQIKIKN